MASGNASRRPLAVTTRNRVGSTSRLPPATAAIASSALPSATGTAESGVWPDRIGTSNNSTTIARSCSRRMPTVNRPYGADNSLRSASPCSTIAVLDSATNSPMKIASGSSDRVTSITRRVTTAAVPTICSVPATRIVRQIWRTAASEKSRPTVNNSSTTPSSASISTSSTLPMTAIPLGPATIPAMIMATMAGTRARARATTSTSAMA